MAQTKVSQEALVKMAETLRQSAEEIMSAKAEMDSQLRSFVWDDPTGYYFTGKYEEDFKPLTEKLVPAISEYVKYIYGLQVMVVEYSGHFLYNTLNKGNLDNLSLGARSDYNITGVEEKTIAALAGVAGGLSAMWYWLHGKILGTQQEMVKSSCGHTLSMETLKEIEFFLTADELFSKGSLDTFNRVAADAKLPKDSKSFNALDKDGLIASLEKGILAEDKRNPIKEGRYNFVTIKTNYRKNISSSTHGFHYTDEKGNEIIWINPLWYKKTDVDNLDVLGTVMHEYEHKLQHDNVLRGRISKEAYNHYDRVSTACVKEFDTGYVTSHCGKEYQLYLDNWQEVRARKASEIAKEAYLRRLKPQVLYRSK